MSKGFETSHNDELQTSTRYSILVEFSTLRSSTKIRK